MKPRDLMIDIFTQLNPANQQEALVYTRVALAAEDSLRASLQCECSAGGLAEQAGKGESRTRALELVH